MRNNVYGLSGAILKTHTADFHWELLGAAYLRDDELELLLAKVQKGFDRPTAFAHNSGTGFPVRVKSVCNFDCFAHLEPLLIEH